MVTSQLLGVFDGHRCDSVAEFVSTNFPGVLAQALAEEEAQAKQKKKSMASQNGTDQNAGMSQGHNHKRQQGQIRAMPRGGAAEIADGR